METDKEMGVVHDKKQRKRAAVKNEVKKATKETQNFKIRDETTQDWDQESKTRQDFCTIFYRNPQ